MNTIGDCRPWKFSHFRKTDGYANMPLDGVWLRAPYLHNGSVPTLRALLFPDERPRTFFVLNGQAVTGTPAFQANGKIVGLLTIRQIDPGRMSMFGLMGGTEGAGVIAVVLAAADVLEIAKQANEGK